MIPKLRLKGVHGYVRWAYRQAATLQQWSVVPAKDGPSTLTATVVSSDAFQVTQRPLQFVAPIKGGAWSWPILSLTITGTTLRALLGPLDQPSETTPKERHELQNTKTGDHQDPDQSG